LLISQQWPEKLEYNAQKAADFDNIMQIVREIRKSNIELGGGQRTLHTSDEFILKQAGLIQHLARIENIEAGQSGLKLNLAGFEAYLSASDAEIAKFEQNLAKRQAQIAAQIKNLEQRLANKSYVANAPAELVAETRAELKKLKSL
jgi:valyl-tRNA synthetase